MKALRAALRAWWEHNVVADDPNPQYSRLDRMDGLGADIPASAEVEEHEREQS